MGAEYLIDYCIESVTEYNKREIFRVYVTDALMYMGESVANAFKGSYMGVRYVDLLDAHTDEEKTGDEIALEVIERAGLKVN